MPLWETLFSQTVVRAWCISTRNCNFIFHSRSPPGIGTHWKFWCKETPWQTIADTLRNFGKNQCFCAKCKWNINSVEMKLPMLTDQSTAQCAAEYGADFGTCTWAAAWPAPGSTSMQRQERDMGYKLQKRETKGLSESMTGSKDFQGWAQTKWSFQMLSRRPGHR